MILTAMVFLSTGCSSNKQVDSDLATSLQNEEEKEEKEENIEEIKKDEIENEIENEIEEEDGSEGYPEWTKVTETDEAMYNNLNLDGIGDSDDSVYISGFHWGTQYNGVTVIQTKLGTGEVLSKVYNEVYIPSVLTGRLQEEGKDSIIVQLLNRGSNYLATKISVLEIVPVHDGIGAELVERLLLTEEAEQISNVTKFAPYPVIFGAEIIDLEGSTLQGLKVPVFNVDDREKSYYVVVQWLDNEWIIGEVRE